MRLSFRVPRIAVLASIVTGFLCTGGTMAADSSPPAARPAWLSGRVLGSPNPPAPYRTTPLFPSLKFENPVDLALLPGSTRIAVADQSGHVWTFDTRSESNARVADLALDLGRHRRPFDSLLGFTFHPGFTTNRQILINYNEPGGRPEGSKVSRFRMSSLTPPVIDPASEEVLITWPSGGHNGCALTFGTDGTLFISTGDGANPDPPDGVFKTGQDVGDLLASILRIDPDHPADGRPYSIPQDNPFRSTPGARPEVWTYGLRNPFRITVDPASGQLYIADVGWEQWEMIHLGRPGANYGWPITEGPNPRVRTDIQPGPGPILPPLLALPHSEAASITGGRVYHGRKLDRLRGAYIFGDWETGKFWALRHDGDRLLGNEELCDTTLKPVAFGTDPDGELIILDYGGGLHGLIPNQAPPANQAFPRRLSDTGLFTDTARHLPAPGVVPYRPSTFAWSDYAWIEHLVAVPGADRIATAGGRDTIAGRMWSFPSNTVFTRTLSLELDRGQPLSRRRIETQMLHFDGQAWAAYTYRWNHAQTDADLVPVEGAGDAFVIRDPAAPGGERAVAWRFLGRPECFRCHNVWAGDLLSFNWAQLGLPGQGSELDRLMQLGLLEARQPPAPDGFTRLTSPDDTSAPLHARARSWLHVNCAGCHVFGAGGGVNLRLNLNQSNQQLQALDIAPTRGSFGIPDARLIAPGDPFRSVLVHRITTEGAGHMPHIGSRLADPQGERLIADWIRALPDRETSTPTPGLAALDRALASLASGPTQEIIEELLQSVAGALALHHHLDAPGRLATTAGRQTLALATAATLQHPNPLIRDLGQRWLPPGQRRQTLGAEIRPSTILALTGDILRGQDLFSGTAQCANCHLRDGVGRSVGPDLTPIGKKYSREQLLDHILHPSKVIAPEYRTVTATLRDESEVSGFVVRRIAGELVIRDAAGQDHVLPATSVSGVLESALSTMPEGLLSGLTAQEAADLLDYLSSQPSSLPKGAP